MPGVVHGGRDGHLVAHFGQGLRIGHHHAANAVHHRQKGVCHLGNAHGGLPSKKFYLHYRAERPEKTRTRLTSEAEGIMLSMKDDGGQHMERKTIILGVIGADVHAVGNQILNYAFTEAGFNVVNLGVMVSQEEFIEAAIESAG